MAFLAPRHPILGLFRLAMFAWVVLSLLGCLVAALAFAYGATYGCVGAADGWLVCTGAFAFLGVGAVASLITSATMLFFSHLFYIAGAESRDAAPARPRTLGQRVRGFAYNVIFDILD
jgi:uncharacterized membrane protein